MLKEDHPLDPEVLLSEAEKVCSSFLFPLSLTVATVETVERATCTRRLAKGKNKGPGLGGVLIHSLKETESPLHPLYEATSPLFYFPLPSSYWY